MEKILVMRECGGWGDVLCTLFAVRGLRLKYPDAHISYFAMPPFDTFLRRVGDIDRVLSWGLDDGEPQRRVRRVHRRHMNAPLNLEAYGLRRHYELIVDCWCPADKWERASNGDPRRSRIEVFCDQAGVSCPPTPALQCSLAELDWAEQVWRDNAPGSPRVLTQLRAAKITKSWPLEYTERIGRILRNRGCGMIGVKVDGPDAAGMPCLMGLSHWRVAALAATCDVVIAPDSALFHLAAALGKPCVATFGPTPGNQYPRHYPLARILQGGNCSASCRQPCLYYERNGFPPRDGSCSDEGRCMRAITPERVAEAVDSIVRAPIAREVCVG